jgi:dehydrodolichyl diphosphate syntase complex subunit NUS1
VTRIKFLSIEDGRPQLAEVIKELVKVKLNTYNNNEPTEMSETNPIEITEALLKRWNYPEPDFSIVCSTLYSVHGYPPWQLRYTEVSHLNHPDDVTVEVLYSQLCVFSKIEQRFGA